MRLLVAALMCCALFGEDTFSTLSVEQALAEAAKNHRIVLIDFYTTWCGPCKLLDSTTWKDEKVILLLKENTISLKVDAEKELALSKKYSITGYPTILLLKADGSVLDRMVGYQKPETFTLSFQSALKGITALDRARNAVSESNNGDLRAQVIARQKLANVLLEQGQNEEALKEYLWLYDDGMKRIPSYSGVRNSFILSGLQRLSLNFPPALKALHQQRDRARNLFLTSPGELSTAQDLFSLNHALKEDQSSVETFDQLPSGSPGRKTLGACLWNEFIERKRYIEALDARSSKDILDQIARQEGFLPPDPSLQKMIRANWLESLASGLEALVGAGRLDDARTLVKKALVIDPSKETQMILDKHIQRSGKPVLLDSLR